MAFNVSYYDLLRKNIRHIYSNLPSNIRFRSDPVPGTTLPPYDGCLSLPNRIYQAQKRPPDRLLRRLWAYSPEYGTTLPRAPALRCVSTAEAQAIVDRVTQRTSTHRRPLISREERDRSRTCADVSRGRRCRSVEEMAAITERVSRPTTAAIIRSDLREGLGLDPIEVVSRGSSRDSARSARSARRVM